MGLHAEVPLLVVAPSVGIGHLSLHWVASSWSDTHSFLEAGVLGQLIPVQALLLLLDDVLMGPTILARKASQFFFAMALNAAMKNCWITLMLTARYRAH